jgi:hypothetical protein
MPLLPHQGEELPEDEITQLHDRVDMRLGHREINVLFGLAEAMLEEKLGHMGMLAGPEHPRKLGDGSLRIIAIDNLVSNVLHRTAWGNRAGLPVLNTWRASTVPRTELAVSMPFWADAIGQNAVLRT